MKIDGKDGVLQHFLMDVDNRLGDLTLISYTHRTNVLVRLLRDLGGVTELEQVTTLHLRQCVQHLLNNPVERKDRNGRSRGESQLSISTVRGYIRVWKAFFSWCYQEELIDTNPAGGRFKPPKEEKLIKPTFAKEYIDKMLAACDISTSAGFRDYVILLLLLDTGIRISELADLRIEDVNFQSSCVKVYGKGRKEREVGIYPEMSKLLWKYIHKFRESDESEHALFLGRQGALGSHGVDHIIKRIQHKAGLDDIEVHAHVFRHTFAKMYLDRGGDLFKLSREMGHSDVRITKIYLEDFGSTEARKDHNSYSPLAGMQFRKGGKRKKRL